MATKYAYPTMQRGADGRQKSVYMDEAGNPVPYEKLGEYEIISGGGTDYYDPTPDGMDNDLDEQDNNPDPEAKYHHEQEVLGPNGGQKSRQDSAGYKYATEAAKKSYTNANRGYINKPAWAKYANFLPGVPGMVAKAVNTGINITNTSAVASARKAMGLKPQSIGQTLKSAAIDQQGQIARVNIGEGQYTVGFESLDKYGRTNMTPEEAMARARALGTTIDETKMTKPAKTNVAPDYSPVGISPPKTGTTEDDENIGGVTNMSDEDVAAAQWSEGISDPNQVPEGFNKDVGVAPTGNVYDESGSIMTGINPTKFNSSIEAWSAQHPTSMPGTQEVSQMERNLQSRNELENIKDSSLAVGRPTMGTKVAGMPSVPGSTGLPAARPGTMVAGRPSTPAPTGLPSATAPDVSGLGVARNAFDTSYGVDRGAINAGITAQDGFAQRNTISAEQAALPGVSRNAFDTQKSPTSYGLSKSNRMHVAPVKGMEMAPSTAPDPARFGSTALSPDLDPSQHKSVYSGAAPTSTSKGLLAGSVTNTGTPGRFADVDLSEASAAKMASMGLVSRTPAERESIARAIAGELSPASLRGLKANDPNALSELASMVSTMENRIASVGTVAGALKPSQYNSLMSENLGVTNQNFGIYGDAINKGLEGFYNGTVSPTDFGATHYHNPAISDPAWAGAMVDPTTMGNHVFGGIPGEYTPGDEFSAMRSAYSAAQISDTRGFAPSTGQLARSSLNDTSYTPGIGKGAYSTPGNSVSGASRSTAGKTFGSGGSRADSGIGRNDSAGAGRGSSPGGMMGGGSAYSGGSSASGGGGNYGGGNTSGGRAGSGKSASGGVSGASRSTSGKGGASPSASSGGQSGAAQSGTSGKTGGGLGAGGSEGASNRSGGNF
jgi:hypothetical protein